ncbi:MAG: polysaccharide deacetylase family protein [Bryobacteraceae bacterium]|nr:polysaccharide deacetylase family protein [Bryobacteraceae bacterium]
MTNPPYLWPEGFSCALCFCVDVDAVTPMMWRLRDKGAYSPREVEQRSFGLRQGVDRILSILADLRIPATFFVPGYIAEHHPRLITEIAGQGHEIGLHGYIHEETEELDERENREVLRKSIAILEDRAGRRPSGYRSPNWGMTDSLPALLQEHGIFYDSSLMGYEHPYTFRGITELPVSWTASDATYYFYLGRGDDIGPPWPAHLLEDAWRDEIAAARRFASLLCLTVHPWMSGRGARAVALERLLREARGDSSIWLANCLAIAEYHRQSPNCGKFDVRGPE